MDVDTLRARARVIVDIYSGPRAAFAFAVLLEAATALSSMLLALVQTGTLLNSDNVVHLLEEYDPVAFNSLQGIAWGVVVIRAIELPALFVLSGAIITGRSLLTLPWLAWSPAVSLIVLIHGLAEFIVNIQAVQGTLPELKSMIATTVVSEAFHQVAIMLALLVCVLAVIKWRNSSESAYGALPRQDFARGGSLLPGSSSGIDVEA